ncbi:MAG: sulfatase-like hydrolase/transferase [Chloroflexi bacterium]|nr:sulfatase-like hydrolase/transferase [Chloroflexota bacterium]
MTDLDWVIAQYDGEVSYADTQLGRLLDAVDPTNTLVVVIGDHGESLGEHGLLEKLVFFEGAVRVPLIVKGLDTTGANTTAPVQLIDVATTIMGAAGAEPHKLDEGHDLREQARPAVFSEQAGWAMALTPTHKVVCHAGDGSIAEVYDRAEDPLEVENLASSAAGAAVAERVWQEHLAPFLADAPPGYAPAEAPKTLSRGMLVNGRESQRPG